MICIGSIIPDDFVEKCKTDRNLLKEYMKEQAESINKGDYARAQLFYGMIDIMAENHHRLGELNVDEFQYMIELGADPNYNIDKLFFVVCGYSKPDICNYLVNNYDVKINEIINDETRLYIYVDRIKNVDILKLFLDQNLPQKILDKMMVWCRFNVNKLNILMEYGANVDLYELVKKIAELYSTCRSDIKQLYITFFQTIKNKIRYTNYDSLLLTEFVCIYITYFSELITLEEIKMFINMGADPSIELKNVGNNCIFTTACCYFRDPSIIKYFIYECNCNINIGNSNALHFAIITKNDTIILLLLNLGINITDTCIQSAIYQENKYINLLLDYGVPIDKMANLVIGNKIDIFKNLIARGVSFDSIIYGC